jgi:hypothetical protein
VDNDVCEELYGRNIVQFYERNCLLVLVKANQTAQNQEIQPNL